MSKIRLFILAASVAAALIVAPAAASADTVTAQCQTGSGAALDCSSLTPPWSSHPKIAFDWQSTEQSLSAGCHDGLQFSVDTEGPQDITCTVTFPDNSSASHTVHVKVDNTAPTVVTGPTPTLTANALGWFAPRLSLANLLSVSYTWTDNLSGTDPTYCDTAVDWDGGDTDANGGTLHADCRDMAGNVAHKDFPIKFDNTPPENVTGTPARAADHDGWYTHDIAYTFTGDDPQPGSGIASCDTITYTGPDSGDGSVTGGCSDNAGNRTDTTIPLKYDGTKPTITSATPDRPADHGDWYDRPVKFTFHGTDTVSGLVSCSTIDYSGPDSGAAQVTCRCTDAAGNVTTRSLAFKYDANAPAKSKLYVIPGDKAVALSWAPPSDASTFILKRSPAIGGGTPLIVYRGSKHDYVDTGVKNGSKYNYTLTTMDAAGNSSDSVLSAVPDGSTLRPFIDTEVKQPPLLTWAKVKSASYYNLQLFKGRKKVLSAWPRDAKFQLPSQWKYKGHRYTLSAGLYRWYVWPGRGRMSAHRYGNLVGSSTFRFAA